MSSRWNIECIIYGNDTSCSAVIAWNSFRRCKLQLLTSGHKGKRTKSSLERTRQPGRVRSRKGRTYSVLIFRYQAIVIRYQVDDNLPRRNYFGASRLRGDEESFIRCPAYLSRFPLGRGFNLTRRWNSSHAWQTKRQVRSSLEHITLRPRVRPPLSLWYRRCLNCIFRKKEEKWSALYIMRPENDRDTARTRLHPGITQRE